jgi:hypothetical protein
LPSEYRSGQISTFRNLPARTKHQIKYGSLLLGVTRAALISAALDEYMKRLADQRRLPENVAKLVLTERAAVETQHGGGENGDGCNRPESRSSPQSAPNKKATLAAYTEMLAVAETSEPTPEDLAFEARMAERRARIDAIMGRTSSTR